MRRRAFVAIATTAVLARPGRAQLRDRIRRIGILETVPPESNVTNLEALRRGLRERGYVEGQNIVIEYRSADGHPERFPRLANELLLQDVDLIVTRGTPATKAAKDATTTVPIVIAASGEPLGVGFVGTLARPGGNITGFSSFGTELAAKRIELLKEAFPSVAHLGFMQDMSNPVAAPEWERIQAAARTFGVAVELLDIRSTEGIRMSFAQAEARRMDALLVGVDALTQANISLIVGLAAERKLMTVYHSRDFVDVGGLFSYGPSYPDLYYRAAGVIDKIFKGTKPGDLPIEQPAKLELIINLKTAKALGLTIPPLLLARADEVIE